MGGIKIKREMMFIRVLALCLLSFASLSFAKQEVVGDFHVTTYIDVQGSVDGVEAYTKQVDKNVFLGVSCSIQSPLPLIQVIAMDAAVLSENAKYVGVDLVVDNKPLDITLNGVLSVVDNADEFSNKVRFDLPTQRGSSFKDLQQAYVDLLTQLTMGKQLQVKIQHHSFKPVEFEFSLLGLSQVISSNKSVCR